MTSADEFKVVVIGGGFAGLSAVRGLRDAPVSVTLLDPNGVQTFHPLLYQVATGVLDPETVLSGHAESLRHQSNVRVLAAEAVDVDPAARVVRAVAGDSSEESLPYDALVVAAGVRSSYGNEPRWAEHTYGLSSAHDAVAIRSALRSLGDGDIVVVGGGPTGVEMAGELVEAVPDRRVILLEAGPEVLPSYPASLRRSAARELVRRGVDVRTETPVLGVGPDSVTLAEGEISSALTIWAAGIRATPVVDRVAGALQAPTNGEGRILVLEDLTVPGHPEVYVVGDAAAVAGTPTLAPAAMQTGRFAAKAIRAGDGNGPDAFRYFDKGSIAAVSRQHAVAVLGPDVVRLSGPLALLLSLGVHFVYLPGLTQRAQALTRWPAWFIHGDRAWDQGPAGDSRWHPGRAVRGLLRLSPSGA